MMSPKRILCAALAAQILVAPLVAEAKTAIIMDRSNTFSTAANAAGRADQATVYQLGAALSKSFIEKFNPGSVDVYTADVARTQLAKSGLVGGKQYDLVLWAGDNGMSASNNTQHPGCAPCSLTFISNSGSAAIPTVPQLFLGAVSGSETGFGSGASCSTSVGGSGFDPGAQGPDWHDQRHHIIGSPKGWPGQPGQSPATWFTDYNGTAGGSGGFRVILGSDASNMVNASSSGAIRVPRPEWRDSIWTWNTSNPWWGGGAVYFTGGANGPSYGLDVWSRLNNNFSGAKPNIFCNWGNHHSPVIGGGDSDPTDIRVQPDPTPIYVAIAWADSITGGAVLGTNIEPAKLAVQVSGGFSRGGRFAARGFAPYDSVTVKASVDSLASLGIPFVVGANVDSLSTYASDLALWQRAPGVKFTLESWTGVDDTTVAGLGAASNVSASTRIIDPFGRFRLRRFYGPSLGAAKDTSLYANLARGRSVLSAFVGSSDKLDGILMPAADDHSPLGSTLWRNVFIDSLAFAARSAGWSGVAQNADDSLNAVTPTNPRGWYSSQRFVNSSAGQFGFLTYPGMNPRGGAYANGVAIAGDGSRSDSSWAIAYSKRSLFGLFNNFWQTPQKRPWLKNQSPAAMTAQWWTEPGIQAEISPLSNTRTGVNLVRISASSLGSGEDVTTPHRPGYYQIKYLKYQVDAINQVAGRNLIQFVYPQDLGEKDIARR